MGFFVGLFNSFVYSVSCPLLLAVIFCTFGCSLWRHGGFCCWWIVDTIFCRFAFWVMFCVVGTTERPLVEAIICVLSRLLREKHWYLCFRRHKKSAGARDRRSVA